MYGIYKTCACSKRGKWAAVLLFCALIAHSQEIPGQMSPKRMPKPQPQTQHMLEQANDEQLLKMEFIISYKALSQNGIITGERYSVSDPLTSTARRLKVARVCEIDTPLNDLISDDEIYAIKYILTHYKDEVLSCLQGSKVRIRHDASVSEGSYLGDSTLIEFPPQRVLASLQNRFLVLEILH